MGCVQLDRLVVFLLQSADEVESNSNSNDYESEKLNGIVPRKKGIYGSVYRIQRKNRCQFVNLGVGYSSLL